MTDTDNTELWREALGVMGYEIVENNAYCWPHVMATDVMLDDEWNLFGLVVEWVEARMQHPGYIAAMKATDGKGWGFAVWHPHWLAAVDTEAETLPLASAKWVCEHGRKIAKEKKTKC